MKIKIFLLISLITAAALASAPCLAQEPAQPSALITGYPVTQTSETGAKTASNYAFVGVMSFEVNYTQPGAAPQPAAQPLQPKAPAPARGTQVTVGVDYNWYGEIANVAATGLVVEADGPEAYTTFEFEPFTITYARHTLDLTTKTAGASVTKTDNADALTLQWSSRGMAVQLPWKGAVYAGARMYYDRGENPRTNFMQPYVAASMDLPLGEVEAGVNWTRGDIESNAGVFGKVKIKVMPKLFLDAEYSEKDFHKAVINDVILPREGVDCSMCDDDALSLGLTYKLGGLLAAGVRAFDINDIASTTAGISATLEY